MADRRGEFWTRERVLVLVLVLASAIFAWLCWLVARPFVPALTWALVLAVIAHPLHERLLAKLKRPTIAAGLAVVAVTCAIALPTTFVVRQVTSEAAASAQTMREFLDRDRWKVVIERFPRLAPVREWIEREVDTGEQIDKASTQVAQGVRGVLQRTFDFGVGMLVTLFLLFYFLRDKWRLLGAIRQLVPLAPAETAKVVGEVRDAIDAMVYGTLVVALLQGSLGGLMFWWLGLPGPILWGTVMALLAVLPIVGAALVWIPATAYLAFQGEWDKALILGAWGAVVVSLIDNLVYPLLVKNRLRMHTVPVFIAVLGGIYAFGATGVVLGPIILVVALALIEIWRRRMASGEIEDAVNEAPPNLKTRKRAST
jgi:predicted PurR-regulated permease PerM